MHVEEDDAFETSTVVGDTGKSVNARQISVNRALVDLTD